jgi:hypothetical protein
VWTLQKIAPWMLGACALHAQVISGWAFGGPDHRLHCLPDSRGNSIMDFSFAGYRGGGMPLPSAVPSQRLQPAPGDNTARIQAALDHATGAVVLGPGEYDLAGTLTIAHSGAVLRGEKGATVRLTGKPHRFLEIHGAGTWREEGAPVPILDTYVPSGGNRFRVRDASEFHPGDRVLVLHPVTAEWLHYIGMDMPPPGSLIRTDRRIESVDGDRITLDAPLSDALDSRFTTASLVRYSFSGRISEAGVEGLRVTAAFDDPTLTEAPSATVDIEALEDGWARDLEIETPQNGIAIGPGAKRLTLTNIRVTHPTVHAGSTEAAAFTLNGTQILVDRCRVTGKGTSPVVVQAGATGPLVVLNSSAEHGGVAPDQGWATGLLVDGGEFPGGTADRPAVAFSVRGHAGSAQEWGLGWSVAWNVSSPFLLVPQPPGTLNWCIGCVGAPVTVGGAPNGIFDSLGKVVFPSSLYLQQLRDRLGSDAIRAIGYNEAAVKLL